MIGFLLLFLFGLAILLVAIHFIKNNREKAKKAITIGGIIASLLFLLRLGPAIILSVLNLIPLLLPFFKKEIRTTEQMNRQEAAEVLGVDENATEEEINKAYIELIKKNHPDKGGSKYLAQKINTAKKVLLHK